MQKLIAFIFVNTIKYQRTLKKNIYHSNKRGSPPFFHLDTNLVIGYVLGHSLEKSHVLVVTVELIWLLFLNILFFNFVPTQRTSLMFTRFRRTYVNRPAVILANHCQSYAAFLLEVRCSNRQRSFFFKLLVPNDSAFALLSIPVPPMLLTPRRLSRRKDLK